MQWIFLVLALLGALAEMHTGTFYLAGVALIALLTALAGFWLPEGWLIYTFVVLTAAMISAIALLRRRGSARRQLPDFDIGQSVTVIDVSEPDNRLTVRYRGVAWEATMTQGKMPAPGDTVKITGKTDKLLHLINPHDMGP